MEAVNGSAAIECGGSYCWTSSLLCWKLLVDAASARAIAFHDHCCCRETSRVMERIYATIDEWCCSWSGVGAEERRT